MVAKIRSNNPAAAIYFLMYILNHRFDAANKLLLSMIQTAQINQHIFGSYPVTQQ
jgi:hypothetical protein